MSPPQLGIDFGTSHTVAVLDRDGAAVPLLFDSSPLLPSAVYAEPGSGLVVGADAVNSARLDPARFEPNPKRRVDDGRVLLGEAEFAVEELFAAVLARVKRECDRITAAAAVEVTLTHPAAWGSARRLVLADAAELAGFGAVSLVPEPVAAAAYFTRVLRHDVPAGSGVVVADLGGGTFDASVVAGSPNRWQVLSVDGIENLGGVDVDYALIGLLTERFGAHPQWRRLVGPESTDDRRLLRGLYEDVRAAKERLSRQTRADLPVPLVGSDTHFTREELDRVTRPLLQRAVRVTAAVIRASGLPPEQLSGVFLVGGASRMPLVANMLHQALGTAPIVLEQPELVVAQGAVMAGREAAGLGVLTSASHPPGSVAAMAPTVGQTGSRSASRVSAPPLPAVAPSGPAPGDGNPPPRSLGVAAGLLWVAGAAVLLWLYDFSDVWGDLSGDTTAPGYVDQRLFRLGAMPVGIAASLATVYFATRLWRPGTRFARRGALVSVSAGAVLAVVVALVSLSLPSGLSPGRPMLIAAVVQVAAGASTVVLLLGPAAGWFARPTSAAVPVPPPSPVRKARALLWTSTAVAPVVTFIGVGALSEAVITPVMDANFYSVNGTGVFLVAALPVLAAGLAVSTGVTAARLAGRSKRVWRSALAAAAATGLCQVATLIAMATQLGDTAETVPVMTALAAVAAMAAAAMTFLLIPAARRAFAAP